MKKDYSIYVGKKFGRLTVLSVLAPDEAGIGTMFHCKCDCGKEKNVPQGWMTRDETKYRIVRSCGCLRKESYKAIRSNIKERTFGRWTVIGKGSKTNYWKCKCSCGTEKEIFRGSLTSGLSTSCGCLRDESLHSKKGPLHHCWNPNLTEEDRRKQKKHWGWSNETTRKVFIRDDWTCQVCQRRGSLSLNSHHIESWNSAPEKRFDLNNVTTICTKCHNKFHRRYGRGNNTREQFDEFRREQCLTAA